MMQNLPRRLPSSENKNCTFTNLSWKKGLTFYSYIFLKICSSCLSLTQKKYSKNTFLILSSFCYTYWNTHAMVFLVFFFERKCQNKIDCLWRRKIFFDCSKSNNFLGLARKWWCGTKKKFTFSKWGSSNSFRITFCSSKKAKQSRKRIFRIFPYDKKIQRFRNWTGGLIFFFSSIWKNKSMMFT